MNRFIYLFISVSCISCTSLKRSQIVATEKFALATQGISRTPADIYFRISTLKSESQSLQLSSILATNDSSAESIRLLKENHDEQTQFLLLAEEYSTAYFIVEKYTDLVLSLLKTSYMDGFIKSKTGWQSSFTKLVTRYNSVSLKKIPSSVGSFTASLLQQLGKMKLGDLQKKYLLEAVKTAHEPFENICNDFISIDSLKIAGELASLPMYIDNNYASFLENIRGYETGGNNPYFYYNAYSPIYNNWLNEVREVKLLTAQSMVAFRQLRDAYSELEFFLEGKGKTTSLPQIDLLIERYEDLKDTYRRFDYKRSKLTMSAFQQ